MTDTTGFSARVAAGYGGRARPPLPAAPLVAPGGWDVPLEMAPSAASSPQRPGAIRSLTRLDTTKKILLLAILAGIIALVAGGGTFATFSAETGNPGSNVASGTLTLSDQVASHNSSGTVCNSYEANSADNYNAACDAIVALTNQAPGTADTSSDYYGGYAQVTIKNTGSIDAALFSLYAPYVGGPLRTAITSGDDIGAGETDDTFRLSSLEGPVFAGDKIYLNYGTSSQQFCAGADVSAGTGNTTIPIAGGYAAGSTGDCTTTTLGADVGSGDTTITVSSDAGFPASGDYDIDVESEEMTVTGGQGTTTWTVTRGINGTSSPAHSSGAAVAYAPATTAGNDFAQGTRLTDTSSDTTPADTDCWDSQTSAAPAGFSSATFGTELNFNSTTDNPLCSSAVLWVQEQSTVGGSTYNYCWFGRGSSYGDQVSHAEDSNGQCRTPTQMALSSSLTTGAATSATLGTNPTQSCLGGVHGIDDSQTTFDVDSTTGFTTGDTIVVDQEEMFVSGVAAGSFTVTRGYNGTSAACHSDSAAVTLATTESLSDVGTLHGNVRTNDEITLSDDGSTLNCYSTQNYYIGTDSSTSPIALTGCYGAPSTTFTSAGTTIQDATAFTALNGSNPSSTISNFDTAHPTSGAIYMPPLSGNGTDDSGAAVQLAANGTAGDTRVFYIGVYLPAPGGTNQNSVQGLESIFGLTFHIDQ